MSKEVPMTDETTGLKPIPSPEQAKKVARQAMRDEDPRMRAAARAEEIRKHRSNQNMDEMDRFKIDAHLIPEGWTYEWKRRTLLGQEDPAYQVELARQGWEPVPASRLPMLMPQGWTGETIERDGMILMERPSELTEEARDVELRRARSQVRVKEQQLGAAPDGQFGRDHQNVRPSIRKGFEPMPVPKD